MSRRRSGVTKITEFHLEFPFAIAISHSPTPTETAVISSLIYTITRLPVIAGMPTVDLSDFAEMRLELISVFLFGILVSAFVVKSAWNGFRKDFASLPEISYGKSFSLVCLWGLLFVIVLTMISGARELMTPGAWIKKGNTYSLNQEAATAPEDSSSAVDEATNARRQMNLELMWEILKEDGILKQEPFPEEGEQLPIPQRMWEVPETHGLKYVYVPALADDNGSRVLLAEPEFFENGRYVLWAEGQIELIPPGTAMPFQSGVE